MRRGLLPALDNGGEHVYDSIVLLERGAQEKPGTQNPKT